MNASSSRKKKERERQITHRGRRWHQRCIVRIDPGTQNQDSRLLAQIRVAFLETYYDDRMCFFSFETCYDG